MQEGMKPGSYTAVNCFLVSCIPAFLIESWMFASVHSAALELPHRRNTSSRAANERK
jgi:hypothetical protein